MKKINIIYWTATILIFLFEGVMPALTSQMVSYVYYHKKQEATPQIQVA